MGLKRFLKQSSIGRWALIPYRFWYASRYFAKPWARVVPWLFRSRELANYTYDLTDRNKKSLAFFVSTVTGECPKTCMEYIEEITNDRSMREHVRRLTLNGPDRFSADSDGKPGKRTLYYALVRALKPKFVFEAGTEKGFGSCVMAAALQKNANEGRPGVLQCVDMSPDAGYLFALPYSEGMIKSVDDSVRAIENCKSEIDLMIHDTMTDVAHERAQFGALEHKLAKNGVVCSAWVTDELLGFAARTGRRLLVFRDEPKDHWYPGSSLAVVFSCPNSEPEKHPAL